MKERKRNAVIELREPSTGFQPAISLFNKVMGR